MNYNFKKQTNSIGQTQRLNAGHFSPEPFLPFRHLLTLCSDFGYYRRENSSECVEQPDLKGKVLEFCLHGKEEQLQTSG